MNNRHDWNDGCESKKVIKNCRIHWMLISAGTSGTWDELFTLEEAANIVSSLNATNTKHKHWFEFENIPVDRDGLEFSDEQ